MYKAKGGYIVHNTHKPFKTGHTHVKDFDTAVMLIRLSLHRKLPVHLSKYLWISLERISDGDKDYCRQLRHIIHEFNYQGRTNNEQDRVCKNNCKKRRNFGERGKNGGRYGH